MKRIAVLLLTLAFTAARGGAQSSADGVVTPSPCWKFAFGEWTPALNWNGAGHAGATDSTALVVRRIRDSVYAHDRRATRTDAMSWERTSDGMLLLLFPAWWPAGSARQWPWWRTRRERHPRRERARGRCRAGQHSGLSFRAKARNPGARFYEESEDSSLRSE